jgi:hypothetical protein
VCGYEEEHVVEQAIAVCRWALCFTLAGASQPSVSILSSSWSKFVRLHLSAAECHPNGLGSFQHIDYGKDLMSPAVEKEVLEGRRILSK